MTIPTERLRKAAFYANAGVSVLGERLVFADRLVVDLDDALAALAEAAPAPDLLAAVERAIRDTKMAYDPADVKPAYENGWLDGRAAARHAVLALLLSTSREAGLDAERDKIENPERYGYHDALVEGWDK